MKLSLLGYFAVAAAVYDRNWLGVGVLAGVLMLYYFFGDNN